MKIYKLILLAFLTTTVTIVSNQIHAQTFIDFSKYAGGTGSDQTSRVMVVVNGETYLLLTTTSADYPVTDGSTYKGGRDIIITKYSATGQVVYATYIGGSGDDDYFQSRFIVLNGEVYVSTITNSPNYPVTNGTVYGGNTDIAITRLNSAGNIIMSTYIGGSQLDYFGFTSNANKRSFLYVANNEITLAGGTSSPDYPHNIPGNFYQGGNEDCFITKLNASTGNIILSKFIGGNAAERINNMAVENGFAYITLTTTSENLPVTIGTNDSVSADGETYLAKINLTNFNTVYSRYLTHSTNSFFNSQSFVLNGQVHIFGSTSSPDYPVTNGTVFINNAQNGVYTRVDTDGSIDFSTYLSSGEEYDYIYTCNIFNGNTYITGSSFSISTGEIYLLIYKINANGSFAYTKKIKTGTSINSNFTLTYPYLVEEVSNDLYLMGVVYNSEYPVTNNSQFYPPTTGYFTHLNPTGDIVYSSFLGNLQYAASKYANGKFYLLGSSTIETYPVTDSSKIKGLSDNILMILNPDGSNHFGTYFGGDSTDIPTNFELSNNDIFINGVTKSKTYPVTTNTLYKGNTDAFLTKLSFCPTKYLLSNDTLRPVTQSICKNSLGQKITGQTVTVPGDSLPTIYLNGVASKQRPIGTTYQWQSATALAGPYTNISNATFKDYTPVVGTLNQYYRRLAFVLPQCGGALVHVSDTVSAFVNLLTAPVLNLSGPYNTCPSSTITIGGAPTASGGNPPYTSYQWDNGLPSIANPTVSPAVNTIYTLIVTDNAGCKQLGQAVVNVYQANAGLDKSNCAGQPVKIGSPQINGLAGVVYNWQPATNITNTNIAQPYVNPFDSTKYTLTLTVPKTGGGSCFTKDTVIVIPVAAPVTTNFAGPNVVICLGEIADIGTAPEAGFNYVWSPGSYLTSNITSATKYFPGNILMPVPNPATIYLTAQKGGCFFTDEVEVATIESRAGITGCGPRLIGLPDRTPRINETYSWALISGPGNFTGVTNLPIVPVSASIGGDSEYGLTVSYKGHSCFSKVKVPSLCNGCLIVFTVAAAYECPAFNVNFGNVAITASGGVPNPIYSWTPLAGLSNYNSATVRLTDNVPRTYFVTITSSTDPSIQCRDSIKVNDPAFSRPIFSANDTATCVNQPVTIGTTNVAGYTYVWQGNGLSNNAVSNPIATIALPTTYFATITDGNGCVLKDTVNVNVERVNAAAGPDWVICNSGVVKLGTAAQPNTTYLWEPQSAPWQNGTNQFSAEPEVLVGTDVTFFVTATTPIGCTVQDTVNVIINNSPTLAGAPDLSVCKRISTQIGNPALPGVTYQWNPTTGLDNASLAQPTIISPQSTITYTLQAIFPGGCTLPATDDVTVNVIDIDFDMPNSSFCPGSPVQLGNAAPTGSLSYTWNPINFVSDPYIANPTANNPSTTASNIYTLTIQNNNGCTATDSITVTALISAPDAGNDKLVCKNASTQIGSTNNTTGASVTYSWSPTIGLSNPASSTTIFTATTVGTFKYFLTKTSVSPTCSVVDSVIIKVEDLVLPVMNVPTICANSCVQIGVAPLSNVQYNWLPITGLSNATIANPVACVGANNITYTLTANSTAGCNASSSVLITVSNIAAAQISIPAIIACVGDTGLRFNPVINPAATSYTYLWSPNDGTLSNINILNPSIINTSPGIKQYTLQVTDTASGCTNRAFANITINSCTGLSGIGDFMWFDTNGNGLQDNGEIGVSNMQVKLYDSAGLNIATVTTNANGYYSFAGILPANNYYVVFEKPVGYSFTTQNVGGIPAINNSKADNVGKSNSFTILANVNILNMDAGIKANGTTPVRLLSFTGRIQSNNTALLNWQTSAEYNNDYFDVERSIDGINFIAIGRVDGNGTTALPHNYSFIDAHLFNGINYYRLKQVDFDGHFVYSTVVVLQLKINTEITTVYNNAANTINIIFAKQQANTAVQLLSSNGQLIKAAWVNNASNYLLQLPTIAAGIYILQIVNDRMNYAEKIFLK